MEILAEKISSVYIYIISIAGAIALVFLIIGGIRYLTSSGQPDKLKEARKQILAAFWGIIILLASYLILITINPQLITTPPPELEKIPLDPLDIPPSEALTPEMLDKIRELAETTKIIGLAVEDRTQDLKNLTDNCDCSLTEPICLCEGGEEGSPCEPKICYSKSPIQPCPDGPEIKINQQRIIAFRYELLYYRNRALAEKEILIIQISKITEHISYLQKSIENETNARAIDDLTEQKTNLEEEKRLKQDLLNKLQQLADLIEQISPPLLEISNLPDKCEYDDGGTYGIRNKCQPSCKTGADYGCHDKLLGCQPDKCSGGNPCPISEIQSRLNSIKALRPDIVSVCDQILVLVEDITNFETIYFKPL